VLEPGRSLTLAERGGAGAELVVGAPGFQVLATMNPGGDFGKKELSPALSNRFTQVCVCVCVCVCAGRRVAHVRQPQPGLCASVQYAPCLHTRLVA
jgi:hypothetical protein